MRMKVVLLVLGIGVPLCLLSGLFFQTILAAFVGGVVGGEGVDQHRNRGTKLR